MKPREGTTVRQGQRFGICIAVFMYSAVIQWNGEKGRDVAWLNDLEVVK
jgi:hypothetical protein